MAGINLSNVVTNIKSSSTDMSTVARISYLFKFTQQSILVVDESHDYGAVGRQYLGELDHVNAALVTVSQKMTDIQLRCRIVEQLASNTIFDPEKPLADTVVNLLEQGNQPLAIVVENAQYLSNVMIAELLSFPQQFRSLRPSSHCDLLLIGDQSAHQKCHAMENSNGFDLVSISAKNGQLYVPQLPEKKAESPKRNVTFISLFVVLLTLLIASSIFMLVQTSQTPKPVIEAVKPEQVPVNNEKQPELIVDEPRVLSTNSGVMQTVVAKPVDVFNELMAEQAIEAKVIATTLESEEQIKPQQDEAKSVDIVIEEAVDQTVVLKKHYDFILSAKSGVVIQFASLSNEQAVAGFIDGFKGLLALSWYPKMIANHQYYVVTSGVYADKASARAALNQLPATVRSQGLWLKDVATAQAELQHFLQSQPVETSQQSQP